MLPGLLLAYFPVKSYLKQTPGKLAAWLLPLMAGPGRRRRARLLSCFAFPLFLSLRVITLHCDCSVYQNAPDIPLEIRNDRAVDLRGICLPEQPVQSRQRGDCPAYAAAAGRAMVLLWLPAFFITQFAGFLAAGGVLSVDPCGACDGRGRQFCTDMVCVLGFAAGVHPSKSVHDPALSRQHFRQAGSCRVTLCSASRCWCLLLWFNTVFLLMANSLNRNARLQQENQLLSMQQQRYENLKTAIEEARQARHDMRHQLNQISALAEAGDLEDLKSLPCKNRLPDPESRYVLLRKPCGGQCCRLLLRSCKARGHSLPAPSSICRNRFRSMRSICAWYLIQSAGKCAGSQPSHRTGPPADRDNSICACQERLLLIEVENAFDGESQRKKWRFPLIQAQGKAASASRLCDHIAEKTGGASTFTHQDGSFLRQRSCSVDKWKYILLPSNHKAPLESVCLPGELMFYFHAARAFTVCIPAGSRTVRPLHAFAGAGPHLHSPESGRTAESLWRSGRRYAIPVFLCGCCDTTHIR